MCSRRDKFISVTVKAAHASYVPGQEVPQIHKLAMSFVLNIDGCPSGFTTPDSLSVNDDRLLRADHSEGNHVLHARSVLGCRAVSHKMRTYPDALI
jgi:hypothetical protein